MTDETWQKIEERYPEGCWLYIERADVGPIGRRLGWRGVHIWLFRTFGLHLFKPWWLSSPDCMWISMEWFHRPQNRLIDRYLRWRRIHELS